MIETTLYTYLSMAFAASGIPVYTEIPGTRPTKFITMEKTGADRSNLLETATVAFQSWAASLYEAADLNDTLKGILDASVALDEISKAEFITDGNYTDPSRKEYRYQAVYRFTHY